MDNVENLGNVAIEIKLINDTTNEDIEPKVPANEDIDPEGRVGLIDPVNDDGPSDVTPGDDGENISYH